MTRSLAERLFGGKSAVGERIRVGAKEALQDLEIVGVVGNVRLYDRRDPREMAVYVPSLQRSEVTNWNSLLVRARDTSAPMRAAVRRAVQTMGHEDVISASSLQDLQARDMVEDTIVAALGTFFGVTALLLAVVGLGGLMSYSVTQRTREIGIRVALGATPQHLVRTVLVEGMSLVAMAALVGLPPALGAARAIRGLLFGVSPWDLATLAAVLALLAIVGGLAAQWPARRAARLPPMVALKG